MSVLREVTGRNAPDTSAVKDERVVRSGSEPMTQSITAGGRTVARNSLLSMAGLIVIGGTRVVYGAMVSRATDPETFGIVGLLTAITMIASYVLPAGLGSATSRFVPFNRGRGDRAAARGLYRLLSRSSLIASLMLGLLAAVAALLILRRPIGEVIEVGLLTVVYSLYTTHKAALYGFGLVKSYLVLEIVGSASTLVTAGAVILAGLPWYLLPFVIGYGIFVIGAEFAIRDDTRGTQVAPSNSERRELVTFTALASAGTLASAGFLQGTQLLAARFAAPNELGFFAAAVTLVTPMYFLPRALALALFPFLSEAHGAGQADVVRRHTDLTTRALLGLLTPLFVAAQLFSAEILVAFGGANYAEGALVFQLLLTAAFLAVIQVPSVNALSSGSGLQLRTPVGWAFTGCAIGLAVVAAVGAPLGAAGVGAGYLLGTGITAIGPVVVVWRRYHMAWGSSLARSLFIVLAGLLLVGVLDSRVTRGPEPLRDGVVAIVGMTVAFVAFRGEIARVLDSLKGLRERSPA